MFSVTYQFATRSELADFVAGNEKRPPGRPAGATAKADKPLEKAAAASKRSKGEAIALLQQVRDKIDTATAKGILKAHGFDKMADLSDDKAEEVYEAAKKVLETPASDELGGGDDL